MPVRQFFVLPFLLLFFASSGLCFTDVTTLEFKGFTLGMSLEQAVNTLKARAYRENRDIRVFGSGEYAISAYFQDDIPLHLVSAKESDYTDVTLRFANNELLMLDAKTRYVTADQARALPDKYTRIFGPFDFRGEKLSHDTTVLFWLWGGESLRPWPPMFRCKSSAKGKTEKRPRKAKSLEWWMFQNCWGYNTPKHGSSTSGATRFTRQR